MTRSVLFALALVVFVLAAAFFIYQRTIVDAGKNGTVVVDVPRPTVVDAGVAAAGAVVDAGSAPFEARAEIVAARGNVQARVGEKGPWTEAGIGQKLATDDAVRAGRNAEATLRMGNGVEVRLSPRSEFTIRELSESVSKIRLDEGHVTASVDENGKRTLKVAAKGTDAEAESSGGQFGVVADGKGQLAVATTTGAVKLSAGGQTVEVPAGQQSAVADGKPMAPKPIPGSLFLKLGEVGNTKTNKTDMVVTGQTDPGSIVRSAGETARVDEKGRFRIRVPLKDGSNTVAVDVVDASGRSKTQTLPTIVVDREKPSIEATTKWGTPSPSPPPQPN